MGLRSMYSDYLYKQAEKRGWFDDVKSIYMRAVRYRTYHADEDEVIKSSDVYELMQDISNQVLLANWTVVNKETKEDAKHHWVNQVIRNPNNYLTQSEFFKLMTNTYLIRGEVFPLLDGNKLHLCANVLAEIDENLTISYIVDGTRIPTSMMRHIKNIGTNHVEGIGLLNLGRDTFDGVMNAEKVLNEKYKKGGLLAYLLKLDAHISPQNAMQNRLIDAILKQLEGTIDSRGATQLIPLGKGYSIDTLKSAIEDDKILDYLNVYKKDLGKFLGINVDTYQELIKEDLEKAMMYLHNKAVRPILKNFEDHLSLLFFGGKSKYRIEAKINILDFVTYSTKTNIAYNIVRTGITSPDTVADKFLGLPKQNTPESQAIYISNDLSKIGEKNATDASLKGGDGSE